jgi:hypothetical protein
MTWQDPTAKRTPKRKSAITAATKQRPMQPAKRGEMPIDSASRLAPTTTTSGARRPRNLRESTSHLMKNSTAAPPNGSGDPVNPAYYQGDYVMRIIEDFRLDFLSGTVVKYLLRAGDKEQNSELQDLKKAEWYLARKIHNLRPKQ